MKKVHISGAYYGLHNIGDEAILQSILVGFNDYNLSVSSFNSSWIYEKFKAVTIDDIKVEYVKPRMGLFIDPKRKVFTNIIKLIKEIYFYKSKDICICGGGTILSDCPWHALRIAELAGIAGVPVFLWSVGMADGTDHKTKKYIKKILNKKYVKRIYTRDQYVKTRLIKLGVEEKKIAVCYDAAINLKPSDGQIKGYLDELQEMMYYNNDKNIVLSLSGEADVVKKTPIEVIQEAIIEIQKKYNANVFLIPTGCGAHCKDIEFLDQIQKNVKNTRITIIKKEFTPEDLVYFLSNVEVIISSRLHLNIFGACSNTPSIGLVRNSKIIDFANLIHNPYIPLENLSKNELIKAVDLVITNREHYVESIEQSVAFMRNIYFKSLREIKELIDEQETGGK